MIQDFPIRGKKVFLLIKRRRWENQQSGEVISKDWYLVQMGTRMTSEFAAFLKAVIALRWQALDEENEQMALAKKNQKVYEPEILSNGDTLKRLLVRSRFLLFKHWMVEEGGAVVLV